MKLDKKDLYIKAKLQEDKKISNQANEIFQNFEGGIKLKNKENTKERKIIKLSLNQAVLAFTSLVIVFILGGNLYAHLNGKPNIYSAIKRLFVKEEKYTASEIIVDKSVESNGIKLTLKTVAMDENVLITKYVAEGEKLAEFYTYPEFEESMIEYVKMSLYLAGWDIGENLGDITDQDAITKARNIQAKLEQVGLDTESAKKLVYSAENAFTKYITVQLGSKQYTMEDAKNEIQTVIAEFESKVSSKYQIMQSNDTLQEFRINAISQKIEKNGNQYIIYNVYNVDTITDLASKFNLSINVAQIGSIKGVWSFSTELEKARLDTRVETIDFYGNEVDVFGNERDGYIKVAVKKLAISDFSSVLMVQKNSDYYMDGSTESLLKNTYTYVVTDENNNVLGTGGTVKAENVYADRIILEDVDTNTKILKVKVYSNIDNELLKTITINIEEARKEKHIELNQSLYNASHGISLYYPGDWTVGGEESGYSIGVELFGPNDVDGDNAVIYMERILLDDIESGKVNLGNPEDYKDVVETSITIAGCAGDSYIYKEGDNYKKQEIRVIKDDIMYFIRYMGTVTQYERYNKTFEEILKTVSFTEVKEEKSYVTYYMDNSSDSWEKVKVYEDNTVTVQISESAKENWSSPRIEANVEYEVKGLPTVCDVAFFDQPSVTGFGNRLRGILYRLLPTSCWRC